MKTAPNRNSTSVISRLTSLFAGLILLSGAAQAAAIPGATRVDAGCKDCPTAVPAPASWLLVFPQEDEQAVRGLGIPIWERDGEIVIAGADDRQLEVLGATGLTAALRVPDQGQAIFLLSHSEGFPAPAWLDATSYPLTPTTDLYFYSGDSRIDPPSVKPFGAFRGVPRIALSPIKVHAADLDPARTASLLAPNPLVQEIVDATSQANWFQDVKDMSGENSVVVGGNTITIRTRYTRVMFPTPASNALATEYILDKASGWGYSGVRETYTATDSGCTQSPPIWQNVVITIPGQVDFGQHQQVLFVTHYDSLSSSSTNPSTYAPGADDAISGGSALFEALRLFRNYGFKNTVKIIFFSGEEQGLCGSVAYTRQPSHPAADIWRVVNMDQTAYDGDATQNLLMDVYNWSLANSPGSVALGDSFVLANTDYGSIINPAKIVRDTTKMCQTDHCPFWNVGVAAIAVTEDLHNNDICPCFDNTDTPTCHDTITQMDPRNPSRLMFTPNFSWPSEKAAIATVAHLAEPLYACPAGAPALGLTTASHSMSLSWPSAAGVTNYVVERAASCAGPFTALASTASTSYVDTNVTNGTTYAYQLRTCPTQVSNCVSGVPNGPSVVYQPASAVVIADSGDHDNVPDNCELVTARVTLLNDGNAPLTGVQLSAVSSAHAGVQVVSALPQVVGSLGIGASAPVDFKFYLGRNGSPAACSDTLPFTVTTKSDQTLASPQGFSFAAEKDNVTGTIDYGFESDFSGWTVTTGSFTRVSGGAPGSPLFSLHSRNINSDCDAIVSPTVIPSASSTMTMWVNYSIEAGTFDRAVVRVINTTNGVKTLIVPTGAPYTTTGDNATLCDGIDTLSGWAGNLTTWTQATFNLSAFAGIPVQIEARFATDSNTLGTQGFWFDRVSITNATTVGCDGQTNSCAALPAEVSPVAEPVQFTLAPSGANYDLRFSEVPGATSYGVYGGSIAGLRSGIYNHGSLAGLCGIADGVPADGQVLASIPASSFPVGSYFLAVARNAAGESVYGSASSGAPIPLALAACP